MQFILARWQIIIPWALAFMVVALLLKIYLSTREQYGFRIFNSWVWHIAAVFLGWWLGRLPGIFLITLPLLIIYYYMLFHLALVVVPFSDPDNLKEWWQRFSLFVWYHWGVQYPISVVPDSLGRKTTERIPGNPFGYFAPGLVWARSHQAVGLTTGLSYSGIRRSGTVFTRPYERPFTVVDLRTQLRTSAIEVVSSDGIPYHAVIFAAFSVDREKWNPSLYHRLLHENPILKDAREPDCSKGTYVFSSARMLALFGTEAVASSSDASEVKTVDWDQRVLYQLEEATREILSQRRLDELWQPRRERPGINAMDDIASAIKEKCSLALRQQGVQLYSCRIVNFEFRTKEAENEKADEIKQKQIHAWSADWQREAEQTRADGKADADLLKQEARAYAYTNLLTAVAEGLQETRHMNPDLPRYVIAVQFISALERFIEDQPEGQELSDMRASLADVKKMIPWTGERDGAS
jgi:hypothetical protein